MSVPVQRIGTASKLIAYLEDTYDADPGSPVGYVIPLSQLSAFNDSQARVEVPAYTGSREAASSVLGIIESKGDFETNMEFEAIGVILKAFVGNSGYAHDSGSHIHNFLSGFTPGSLQLQKVWTEPTAQFIRHRGVRVDSMAFTYQPQGPSKYKPSFMGLGDIAQTDLSGTVNSPCFQAVSYFNGFLKLDGTTLATVTAFDVTLANQLSRQEVAFNGGVAGAVNAGLNKLTGNLSLLFDTTDNLTFYNETVADHQFTLECLWADQGGSSLASATKWLRMRFPKVKIMRPSINVGGNAGLVQACQYMIEFDCSSGFEAFVLGTVKGPYTITMGSNDQLKVVIDGGSPQTVTIPPATYADAVALAAAVPTITGATVDAFNGFLRITSTATSPSASIVDVQTVANDCYTAVGLATGAHDGFGAHSFLVELNSPKTTSY
jgi:hypothetical protein